MLAPRFPIAFRLLGLAMVTLAPPVAHADCSAVIAAYTKAQATKQFGWVDADKLDAPAKKGPFSLVNIGNEGWLASDDGKFRKIPAGGAQARADRVRDDEKNGKGRCEPLGQRKVGADPVVGYLVRDNGKGEDFTALHVWISKSTGLPVFHGLGETNGFRWVYGADVAPPPAGQVVK
jgi:hypothetical protein